MTREEMLELMHSSGIDGHSKLNMRSENIQHKQTVKRIGRLKKAIKKKSKLLVIAELAVPFNPATGKADDEYNPDRKYRPPFSATSVAKLLKGMANDNPDTKEAFMKRAGVSEWDTSDVETLTDEDIAIFKKYRVPRVFSIPVCKVNIPKITGNNFGKEFAVHVERDSSGNIVGDWPMFLKVNKLFRDICYEKIADFNKKIESGEEVLNEQQQKEVRSKFRQEIAVSDDNPSNWVQIVELPLTSKYEISGDSVPAVPSVENIEDLVVIHKYNKDIEERIRSYTSGDLERFDTYFDFFEIDMVCPSEGDDSTQQGKMLLGKDTKFEKLTLPLNEDPRAAALNNAIIEYIDSKPDIEETIRKSTYISDYNEEVENQILTALSTVLDLDDNPFVTEKVVMANSEVIMLAFGEEGSELVENVSAGVSDKAEGNLDDAGSTEVAKDAKYDLNSEAFVDDLNLDSFQMQ